MQLPPLPLTSYQNTSLLSLLLLSDMPLLHPHPWRFVLAFNRETLYIFSGLATRVMAGH